MAEVQTARQNGTLVNNVSRSYPNIAQTSNKTRAEVKQELMSMSAAEEQYRANLYSGS
jgi:hypothetical protein